MWGLGPVLIPILKRRFAAGGSGLGINSDQLEEVLKLCMNGGCGPRGSRGRCGPCGPEAAPAEGPQEGTKAPVDPGMAASGSKDVPMQDETAEQRAAQDTDEPSLEDLLRGVLRGVAGAVCDVLQASDAALEDVLAEHHAAEASLAPAGEAAGGVAVALDGLHLNEAGATPEEAGEEATADAAGSPGRDGEDFEMLEKGSK
jgi:hypothetical protein